MQTVRMIIDEESMDPREWENLGKMVCWHSRYNLGDKHSYSQDEFFIDLAYEVSDALYDRVDKLENEVYWRLSDKIGHDRAFVLINDKIEKSVEKILDDNFIILPLYLYDHSGITMKTFPFSCIWDSGQVGYIFCKKSVEGLTDEQIESNLCAEVETYSRYIEGDVYGYVIEENGEVDSCWGFYGSDPRENGMSKHLTEEQLEILFDNL